MSYSQVILFSLFLIIFILLAAFFSCAETGLMAINRYRLRHKARLKKRYAIRLIRLLKRPDRVLGIILIGSTFCNIFASSIAALIAFHLYGDHGAFISAFILTFIILIFTEITPKTLAALYPEQVSRWVVYPIQFLLWWLYPVVWLANSIANGILRLLRIQVNAYAVESLSREELRSIVYDTTGKISRQYQQMLLSILDLNQLTVDDVMVPRYEMLGLDIEQPWEKIVGYIEQAIQEWIPVYRDNMNQIVGTLYTRDVLRLLALHRDFSKEELQQFLHEPYFVPGGTSLNVQLAYFQQSPDKLAFVVDEYGEIQGLVTLNDILEEIVGDFTSNIAVGKRILQQADGSYLVDGGITVREFNRLTEWELPQRARTINGLIVEYLEALPRLGTAVLIAKYPIEIVQVKENRVKLARIFPQLKE